VANYCFVEASGKRALFAEACTRGWLAAVLDFPRLKNREECTAAAQIVPDELRAEVCCIGGDDSAYRLLVTSAWIGFYMALPRETERQNVIMASVLKAMSTDEALARLRRAFLEEEAQAEIDSAYKQYLDQTEA